MAVGRYSDSPTTGAVTATGTLAQRTLSRVPVGSVTFSPAAGGSNVCEVTITVKDGGSTAIARAHVLDVWLSDASSGAGLTGTTASGTVTAKSASGVVLSTYTAKKDIRVQTLATGVFILEITDSAKTGFYVCAKVGGETYVSSVLVTANYG